MRRRLIDAVPESTLKEMEATLEAMQKPGAATATTASSVATRLESESTRLLVVDPEFGQLNDVDGVMAGVSRAAEDERRARALARRIKLREAAPGGVLHALWPSPLWHAPLEPSREPTSDALTKDPAAAAVDRSLRRGAAKAILSLRRALDESIDRVRAGSRAQQNGPDEAARCDGFRRLQAEAPGAGSRLGGLGKGAPRKKAPFTRALGPEAVQGRGDSPPPADASVETADRNVVPQVDPGSVGWSLHLSPRPEIQRLEAALRREAGRYARRLGLPLCARKGPGAGSAAEERAGNDPKPAREGAKPLRVPGAAESPAAADSESADPCRLASGDVWFEAIVARTASAARTCLLAPHDAPGGGAVRVPRARAASAVSGIYIAQLPLYAPGPGAASSTAHVRGLTLRWRDPRRLSAPLGGDGGFALRDVREGDVVLFPPWMPLDGIEFDVEGLGERAAPGRGGLETEDVWSGSDAFVVVDFGVVGGWDDWDVSFSLGSCGPMCEQTVLERAWGGSVPQ
jgi:hypothetical protein